MARSAEYLESLVRELSKLPTEVEWAEFKCNNKDPERIASCRDRANQVRKNSVYSCGEQT